MIPDPRARASPRHSGPWCQVSRRKKDPAKPGRAKGDPSKTRKSQGTAQDPGIQRRLRKAPGKKGRERGKVRKATLKGGPDKGRSRPCESNVTSFCQVFPAVMLWVLPLVL